MRATTAATDARSLASSGNITATCSPRGTKRFPRYERLVQATGLAFARGSLLIALADGRLVSVPLTFFPTLCAATPQQRAAWHYVGPATGFLWQEFDLLLSAADIAAGRREHRFDTAKSASRRAA